MTQSEITTEPCGRTDIDPHSAHKFMRGRKVSQCPGVESTPVPAANRSRVLSDAADDLDRYVGLQSSDAAPEVEGARLVIRELRRLAKQCGHTNPEGGERCSRHPNHLGFHRHALSGGDSRVTWLADIPTAPVAVDVEAARVIARRLAAHAAGFQDALDDSDRDPWAKTVGADITALCGALGEPVVGEQAASEQDATCTPRCSDVSGIRGLLEHVGIDTTGRNIVVGDRVVDPATEPHACDHPERCNPECRASGADCCTTTSKES